jgi:hypothetical protein
LQEHFEESQFEANRADGTKLLRPDAIPTVFSYQPLPRHRKPPCKRGQKDSLEKVSSLKRLKAEHSYCSTSLPATSRSASISNKGT